MAAAPPVSAGDRGNDDNSGAERGGGNCGAAGVGGDATGHASPSAFAARASRVSD